jgi:tetratricopeptide (TPR) repeat protein
MRIGLALDETRDFYRRDQMPEAFAALKRADDLLTDDPNNTSMRQRTQQWKMDLAMVDRLQEIRLNQANVKDNAFDLKNADPAYRSAFDQYGLDVRNLDAATAGKRIKKAAIAEHLIAALDHWLRLEPKDSDHLRMILNAADPESWRVDLRDVQKRKDLKALELMAKEKRVQDLPASSQLALAMTLETVGRVPLAVELLRATQRRHVKDFWVNHELGRCLRRLKPPRPDEAAGFYRAALAVRPGNPGVRVNLGNALREQWLWAEAEAEYRAALEINPKFALARRNLAVVLADQGRLDEAIHECKELLKVDPNDAVARRNLAKALALQGRGEEAVPEFKESIRLQPYISTPHIQLGDALFRDGKFDEALDEYKQALAFDRFRIGLPLWRKGQTKEAAAEFRRAVVDSPENAEMRNRFGTILLKTGSADDAIVEFRAALHKDPNNVESHIYLGTALQAKGRVADAIAQFETAIRVNPLHGTAHYNLGNALHKYQRWADALKAYQEAIRLKPGNADAHANRGETYRALGMLDESAAAYREALQYNPNLAAAKNGLREVEKVLKPQDATGHQNLAKNLLFRKKLAEAEAEARTAIRLDASLDLAHCTLGEILYRQGKPGESEATLLKALTLKPGDENVMVRVAGTYAVLGQWERAEEIFRRAKEASPHKPLAWQNHVFALLGAGRLDDCRKSYQEMFDIFREAKDLVTANLLVIPGITVASSTDDGERLLALAVKTHPRTQAAVLYRVGKHQEAIVFFEQSAQTTRLYGWDWFVLAMAHHQLGHTKEAAAAFQSGLDIAAKTKDAVNIPWQSRVRQEALRLEAEALLKKAR